MNESLSKTYPALFINREIWQNTKDVNVDRQEEEELGDVGRNVEKTSYVRTV